MKIWCSRHVLNGPWTVGISDKLIAQELHSSFLKVSLQQPVLHQGPVQWFHTEKANRVPVHSFVVDILSIEFALCTLHKENLGLMRSKVAHKSPLS